MAKSARRKERTAYHEAGHAVAWLSAPCAAAPEVYAITIEPDRTRRVAGEVRQRRRSAPASSSNPRVHQLLLGRALGRRDEARLARALSAALAHVRVAAAGAVAEAIFADEALEVTADGQCDYWDAYEFAATAGLDPEGAWRGEARRAHVFLTRSWDEVSHLAKALLRRPAGARTIAGAALRSMLARSASAAPAPFGPPAYESLARHMLGKTREAWARRAHYAVIEPARRPLTIARYEAGADAAEAAAALGAVTGARFDVRFRRPR